MSSSSVLCAFAGIVIVFIIILGLFKAKGHDDEFTTIVALIITLFLALFIGLLVVVFDFY